MSVNLQKEVRDGQKAERVMSETKEYFDMVRSGILEAWAGSPVQDIDGQHKLRLMLKLLEDVKANIKTIAETGQLASIQIREEEEKKSRFKSFLNHVGVRV